MRLRSEPREFATDGLGCATDRPRAGRLGNGVSSRRPLLLMAGHLSHSITERVSSRAERGTSQRHTDSLPVIEVICVIASVLARSLVVCATRDDWRENRRNSPRFCVRSLLDLFKARIGILNPIACVVNFSWIDWDCARNRLGARHQLSVKLHRLRAFDWKFPVMPEFDGQLVTRAEPIPRAIP